jgi:hypothetical protein
LASAQEAMLQAAMGLLAWSQEGKTQLVPLVANRFLNGMSELAVGWLLLDAALIGDKAIQKLSATDPDRAFYDGKKFSALWYARNVLPNVEHRARLSALEDTSPIDIADEAFGGA